MPLGPVELLVVQFPKSQVKGDIVPALEELVNRGTIRIIDILFIKKDQQGQVTMIELNELDDKDFAAFNPLVSDISGLLSEDDVQKLSAMMENDTSAGLMLFENTWATRFRDAVANAQGRVLLNERIPATVINQVMREEVPAQM